MNNSKVTISIMIFIFLISLGVFARAVLIDAILAVVNQQVITLSDLKLREKGLYGTEASLQGLSDDARIKIREKILQDLIDEKLMINEAKRLNLTPSDADIQDHIEQIKMENNRLSDKALETALAEEGLTIEDLQIKIYEDVSLLKIRQQLAYQTVQVTDQEILKYYETQWSGHKEGVRVVLSHILLKCPEAISAEEENAIFKKSEQIMHKWKNGESFSDLAAKYSEDPSTASDGNLGKFYFDDLKPEFSKALANIQPGDIAGPIRTELGYHILFLKERKESGLEKGSAIWNKIEETIHEKKKADNYEAWIKRLRKEAIIEIHQDALDRYI